MRNDTTSHRRSLVFDRFVVMRKDSGGSCEPPQSLGSQDWNMRRSSASFCVEEDFVGCRVFDSELKLEVQIVDKVARGGWSVISSLTRM